MNPENVPDLPIGSWAESGVEWLTQNVSWLFDAFSALVALLVGGLTGILLAFHPLLVIVVLALLAWGIRSWRLALGTVIMLAIAMMMGQFVTLLQTMALVLVAALLAVIVAIPLGIWSARSKTVSAIVRPIMDFMQTMPAFVYLIPAVTFFSIGVVPGLFATFIFSLPPGVRMTELGIRQVDSETVEAGEAFGASSWQVLRGIQLPLAVPTIMAGINQVIMLALSMAVIAGMVGADGLGKEVTSAISTLNLAQGVEAGLAVVFLAIYLDRMTGALGDLRGQKSSLLSLTRSRSR